MTAELDANQPPDVVFAALEPAVQQLVVACNVLYAGNWHDCAEDIARRANGQPYLYRLALTLPDLPAWVERLGAYEQARGERFVDACPQVTSAVKDLN